MSMWKCPLCGKQNSIRFYDPTDYADDIIIILMRGLGKGKGFETVEEYSLLDGSDPDLLELISDRIAVIYDLLYEDVEDDEAEVDLEDDEAEEYINDLDEEKIE